MLNSFRGVVCKTVFTTLRWSTNGMIWRTLSGDAFAAVELNNTSRLCLLKGEDGAVIGMYPYVWLRDNCRCSQCFHPSSRGRLMLMANLDPDIVPMKAEISVTDQELHIQWPDKHSSQFPLSWLRKNQFSKMPKDPVSEPSQTFWSNELQSKVPTFTFKDVQNSDKSLHDWIESLQVYGLALIKEAPKEQGAVKAIVDRMSFLKPTNYGEVWQVFSKYDASNLAYTNAELGLHADLPFYEYAPNIQMLHCIKQALGKGGENQFCDGFKIAENIRQKDPEVFHILSTTSIDFRDWGTDFSVFHMKYRRPTIEFNSNGSYKSVSYNDQVRAPDLNIPVEDVYKVYRALKVFSTEMNKECNRIEIKLQDGEIICFNNQRVFHGRSGFFVTESSSRHYEGAYMDWDEVRSRMRVIREKMLNLEPL